MSRYRDPEEVIALTGVKDICLGVVAAGPD